ncbi:MAG: polysaccharide biosynthesis/export family protein [Brevundimonas sp.]|uniref:polysaccharide biosynthesis/export family protein n=1 Tax=Brevundimonas sp. TaxID=1871086 RepID=UPI002725DE57|nr:polysaccharide biosynthesis/export family protein [Brevundimonas sp.]MDO9589087.1 polysaccharide biosynthesis/export family protein [Brevundimonas sp.]MDP3656779.1 polysaccharide biosynthesis/export family protein [Brevundimonas sp.]MDZ4113864.1 polysaccharide biosynthesis/export family protein [Brevundimonas sp.]
MSIDRRLLLLGLVGAGAMVSGCGGVPGLRGGGGEYGSRMPLPQQAGAGGRIQTMGRTSFPEIGFADWTEMEPEYVLYPGDEIEIATPTAAELTRTQRIGPDGRISLPLVGQIMAADRTIAEVEADASVAFASQLRRPVVEITLKTAGPIRVWVGGEVRTPGMIEMNGDLDAYQAVIQAGDFLPTARQGEVALIRRGPAGVRMMRAVDLRPRRGEVVALRRGDIIFVPRSTLGEVANFVTLFRNALPVGFSYMIGGQYQSF